MTHPSNPFFSDKSEQKDLSLILLKYLRYWYLFVISGFIFLAIGILYLRYTKPMYTASLILLVKDDSGGQGMSENLAFNDLALLNVAKNLQNEMVLMKSTSLMERVLKELDFNVSYYLDGRFQDMEIYKENLPVKVIINKLSASSSNKKLIVRIKNNNIFELEDEKEEITQHKFGEQIQKSYGVFTIVAAHSLPLTERQKPVIIKFNNIYSLASGYAKNISIAPVDKETTVLKLSLNDAVPQKAIDIITKLVEVYNKEAVEDKNQVAFRTINFIEDRLKFLTQELSSVEKNVENYKRENQLADVTSQTQLYVTEATSYSKQISDVAIQQDILESIQNYLTKQGDNYELVPSTLNVQDPTLSGLIAKFNDLQLERERVLRTVQPNNPIVLNMVEQLNNLRVNILENLKNIKTALSITIRSLQAKSAQYGSRIDQVPMIERELVEITRQQDIKRALYLYLLQKKEESSLSFAATVSNTKIVDPATSFGPVSPNRTNIYLYSLVLGLFLPAGFIYLKELLSNKVEIISDVDRATTATILGEIEHNKSNENIVVKKGSKSPIVEMFRLVRANLHFASAGKENRVLLITSSMTGEGKSFISLNLAASLVSTEKKVVLIDMDLRKPKVSKELGFAGGVGISSFLASNNLSIPDILRTSDKVPGLAIISSGPIPPNPNELMMSPKLGFLIDELKKEFDYILIDSAPIGMVADAFSISSIVDATIYIIRYNYTLKKQIQILENINRNKSLPQPLVILNDLKKENGNKYGYGYGYGVEDSKKKKRKTKV